MKTIIITEDQIKNAISYFLEGYCVIDQETNFSIEFTKDKRGVIARVEVMEEDNEQTN